MRLQIGRWLDPRVVVYGVVLPAVIYLTWATVIAERSRANAQSTQALSSGTEIVAVFFTTSTCVGNSYPGFRDIVRNINVGLADMGRMNGFVPRRIGVSLDFDIEAGLATLREFGPFDEVSIGNNWVNTAALRYMMLEMPGKLAVPQLVVVRREVFAERGSQIAVDSEEVLLRLVGSDEIDSWYGSGMPLEEYSQSSLNRR